MLNTSFNPYHPPTKKYENVLPGTSLVVQWLRILLSGTSLGGPVAETAYFQCWGPGSSPGQEQDPTCHNKDPVEPKY